jgi:hypothetical protein
MTSMPIRDRVTDTTAVAEGVAGALDKRLVD